MLTSGQLLFNSYILDFFLHVKEFCVIHKEIELRSIFYQ